MYEKRRCLENIYSLAKLKNIKIGDLEEQAGVSKGYLSRINKEDSTSSPTVELLDSIARQLGVGIDYLVNFSHEDLTPNEQLVFQFIDKLTRMTLSGKLEWLMETRAILTADNADNVVNPLVSIMKERDNEGEVYDTHVYSSAILDDGNARVSGPCYYAKVKGGATIFLNLVTYTVPNESARFGYVEEKGIVEVYLHSGTVQPICSTFYVADDIKKAVDNLYEAASSTPSKISLTKESQSIMRTLINSDD